MCYTSSLPLYYIPSPNGKYLRISQLQWATPIFPTTCDAEFWGIAVGGQPWQKVSENSSLTNKPNMVVYK
jgi:hypothetical protein